MFNYWAGYGHNTAHACNVHAYNCSPSIDFLASDRVLKPVTQNTVPKNVQRFERVEIGGKMIKQATEVCAYLPE